MNDEQPKVLIVDDEPFNVMLLEAYLHDEGYVLLTASNGVDALRVVADTHPDLVLLDVMMPDMNGLEVCSRLKGDDVTRFIPVVIVTSLDQKSGKISAIKAGADDFITKPVDKTELLARARSLLKIKSLHDQLEKKYQEVLELQSLKDNLMHMLVHDIRNPLTGLVGYLDLMELNMKKNEYLKIASSISKSQLLATRMGALISDIMDIARLEENKLPLHLEQVYLRGVVEGCLKEFEHAVEEKKIAVVIEEGTPGIGVVGDRVLLHRTIGNILGNGLRYSPVNGVIRLSISADAGMALLSIADEGPGIPISALDKIFDKFYQVDKKAADARSGAGLGLAFCNLVVKAHGGGIAVKNNPDRGCRFILTLPM